MAIIFRFIFSVILLITACSHPKVNGNYLGVSHTHLESENKGFLYKEICIKNSKIRFDNINYFDIDHVFIERKWRSNDDLSNSAINGSYQLIVRSKANIHSEYGFEWDLNLRGGSTFTTHGNRNLVVNIDEFKIKDTIVIELNVGDIFYKQGNEGEYKIKEIILGVPR